MTEPTEPPFEEPEQVYLEFMTLDHIDVKIRRLLAYDCLTLAAYYHMYYRIDYMVLAVGDVEWRWERYDNV